MTVKPSLLLLLSLSLLGAGCNQDPLSDRGKVFLPAQEATAEKSTATVYEVTAALNPLSSAQAAEKESGIMELEWDDLIPPDWHADPELVKLYQAGEIGDDDPRVIETRQRLEMPNQPANRALDGKRVKIPGFVVPLELGEKKITEFLLVPYHGACIHVPPPPTNQTVFVKTGEEGAAIHKRFDTVWVTGRLTIENIESDLAEAGYILYADKVEPYE